jgi:hypothetical protein
LGSLELTGDKKEMDTNRVTGFKIPTEESITFLYASNEHIELKLKTQCYLQLF